MTAFLELPSTIAVQRFRAELWCQYHELEIARWPQTVATRRSELPPSLVRFLDAGGQLPAYGTPTDWTGLRGWQWVQQSCPGYRIYPVRAGDGAVVELFDGGTALGRIARDVPTTIVGDDTLLAEQDTGPDRAGRRARRLLGLEVGRGRDHATKTPPGLLRRRDQLTGPFEARFAEVEAERAQAVSP